MRGNFGGDGPTADRRAAVAYAFILLALFAAGVGAGYRLRQPPLPAYQRLTFRHGGVASARFLSDGHTVVYSATWEGAPRLSLYSARTDTRGASELNFPAGDIAGVSAAGELAVFAGRPYPALQDAWLGPRATLSSVPMNGGALRDVLPDVVAPWALHWFPDSQRFLVTGNERTARLRAWVVDTRGGEPRVITPEGIGCWLVSPDGRTAACARPEGEGYLYPLEGGAVRPIPSFRPGDHLRQWSDDGRYLYVTERYAKPARISRLDLVTGERRVWRELAPMNPAGVVGSIDPAITPDGSVWAYSVLRYLNDLYVIDGLS